MRSAVLRRGTWRRARGRGQTRPAPPETWRQSFSVTSPTSESALSARHIEQANTSSNREAMMEIKKNHLCFFPLDLNLGVFPYFSLATNYLSTRRCPVLAKNRHINHTGKPSVNEGFCKTATVRTIAFRGQLIANHCSLLVCTRVSTLRTIAVSCAYQNPQKCAHARNTLETPCRPKQWGAVPDLHLGWVSSARVLQLRARHRT